MDADEIKVAVNAAVELRPPKFEERLPPSAKIEALESYLLASAYAQAELEEVVFYLGALIAELKIKVEEMTGWEALLPSKPRDRITQADIQLAKRRTDRTTFELGAEARHLYDTALRQIERFRFEAQWVVSRDYSMISGG